MPAPTVRGSLLSPSEAGDLLTDLVEQCGVPAIALRRLRRQGHQRQGIDAGRQPFQPQGRFAPFLTISRRVHDLQRTGHALDKGAPKILDDGGLVTGNGRQSGVDRSMFIGHCPLINRMVLATE